MAVAKIAKMRLVCLNEEKDKILDSLQKTGMVQIKNSSLSELQLNKLEGNSEDVLLKKNKAELALSIIEKELSKTGNKEQQDKFEKDGFEVSTDELYGIIDEEEYLTNECNYIVSICDEILSAKTKINEYTNEINKFSPYLNLKENFSMFSNTKQTTIYLGLLPSSNYVKVEEALKDYELVCLQKLSENNGFTVVSTISYKDADKVLEILIDNGFIINTDREDINAEEKIKLFKKEKDYYTHNVDFYKQQIIARADISKKIKILLDYYKYEIEKQNISSEFLRTNSTIILEAFVPEKYKDKIIKSIEKATDKYEAEFVEVDENDNVPTFMDNGKIAQNFEFITNMYSVPKYGSLDPNAIMGFFFSLFLGIIEADVIYGLILAIGGFLFAKKQRGGIKRLANIIALGGLFAIPFGFLFDSFFGFSLIHRILGNDSPYAIFYTQHLDGILSFSKVAGIDIPSLLLWSMLFGIIHLTVGYILKGVQEFRYGNTIDGLIFGIAWGVFMIGLGVLGIALLETVQGNIKNILQTSALILIAISLLFAIVFAGKNEKGLGKLKSSFGAAYGIINILSDVLSYARIYGLMLSGAQIGAIFTNTIAIDLLFSKGIVGMIAGVLVIVVGNIFNLAMGVLGAYIHDSRLQYVEFFGKFYEGDGELFTPLGSSFDHIVCVPDKIN